MADVFRALDDDTRRLVLDELSGRDGQTLFEICSALITRHHLGLTRQAISQHLGVLESAGLVLTERRGRSKFHYFNPEALAGITERWPARTEDRTMKIALTSVFVDDQPAALAFYTEVLGFTKRRDIPLGDNSWLTVVSPESPDGPELLLEPADHPAVKPYRDALVADGIPLAQFAVSNLEAEHARLTGKGVVFTQPPTDLGAAVVAVFDDTCGNLIQLMEEKPEHISPV